MTFDEAMEQAHGMDTKIDRIGAVLLINQLQQTYAPTIEMRKVDYDFFMDELNSLHNFYGFWKDNAGDFDLDEEELMTAWIHPELIKVVDDESN